MSVLLFTSSRRVSTASFNLPKSSLFAAVATIPLTLSSRLPTSSSSSSTNALSALDSNAALFVSIAALIVSNAVSSCPSAADA